jgi:hypothetical protein
MGDEEVPLCAKACAEQQALKIIDARDVPRITARECAAKIKRAYKPPISRNDNHTDT